MEVSFDTIKSLITATIEPLTQRISEVENTINKMTIANKTTIHYTDDEQDGFSSEEDEEIHLIDFGPEIDEIKERFTNFEAEIREFTEAAETRQMIRM